MAKEIWIVGGVVLLVVVAVIYVVLSGSVKAIPPKETAYMLALCSQWSEMANCSCGYNFCSPKGQGLTNMDRAQAQLGEPNLTALCNMSFPSTGFSTAGFGDLNPTQAAVQRCQDVCRAGCSLQLWYDLAVYSEDITQSNVTIRNEGTSSVFDVSVKIEGYAEASVEPAQTVTKYIDIPAKSSAVIKYNLQYRKIYVEIDTANTVPEVLEGCPDKAHPGNNNCADRRFGE